MSRSSSVANTHKFLPFFRPFLNDAGFFVFSHSHPEFAITNWVGITYSKMLTTVMDCLQMSNFALVIFNKPVLTLDNTEETHLLNLGGLANLGVGWSLAQYFSGKEFPKSDSYPFENAICNSNLHVINSSHQTDLYVSQYTTSLIYLLHHRILVSMTIHKSCSLSSDQSR